MGDATLAVKPKQQPASAKVIDQWGNAEKQRRAINLNLSSIVLPPMTRRGVATYRVITNDIINPSSTFRELAEPQTIILPGTYQFYDKGKPDPSSRWMMMQNVTGARDIVIDKVTGKQVIEEVIEPIVLQNGVLTVNIEVQYRKYVFMELHPLNRSNKFRVENGPQAVFERVDLSASKSLAYKLAEQDLGRDAEGDVMKMDKDKVIGFATSCGIPTYENGQPRAILEIKSDLRVFARKDPRQFYAMSNNLEAAVRMNVLDALGFGIIEYEPEKKRFVVPYVEDDPLFVHLVDEDANEALIKHMASKEGAEKYKALVNMIEYWK